MMRWFVVGGVRVLAADWGKSHSEGMIRAVLVSDSACVMYTVCGVGGVGVSVNE